MRPQQQVRRRQAVFSGSLDLGRRHKPDFWLLMLCAALLAIGLIVVYAIGPALAMARHVDSSYYVNKQLIAISLSFVAFFATSKIPLSWWKKSYKPILIAAGLATFFAFLLPVNPDYPAHRWVRLGGFSFQSVELVKFAVMIWMAGFLADRLQRGEIADHHKTLKPILIALAALGVVVAVVQSDLGSMGVIVAMMGTIAFVAGLPLKKLALFAVIIAVGLFLAISTTPYRRERFQAYLNPEANCQTSGYQACQAMIAVGSGGIFGLGLGSSVQAYGYLPEAANDSIFAIYAEKFGFLGCLVLLALFVSFFSRIKNIAERLNDDFSRLVVVGVLAWLSVQAVINIGAMIGLLPLKGITLPFISYGGTSVVFVSAAVGLVYQASQYTSLARRSNPSVQPAKRGQIKRTHIRRSGY